MKDIVDNNKKVDLRLTKIDNTYNINNTHNEITTINNRGGLLTFIIDIIKLPFVIIKYIYYFFFEKKQYKQKLKEVLKEHRKLKFIKKYFKSKDNDDFRELI